LMDRPLHGIVEITKNPFDSEFSIWYLLVDLIELPKLAAGFIQQFEKLRSIKHRLPKESTLKDVSNSYLAVQFGLLPTIDDIRQFCQLFTRWGLLYSKLQVGFNKGYIARSGKIPKFDGYQRRESLLFRLNGSSVNLNVDIRCSDASVYHTSKYYFVCPELSGALARIKQLTDLLGILDPAAIWDAIPFSFLIDWVIPVGQWVHSNLKPELFPATVMISDWGESLGRRLDYTVSATYLEPRLDEAVSDLVTRRVAVGTVTQYARRNYFPRVLKVVRSNELLLKKTIVTVKRILIGSALIAQRKGSSDSVSTRKKVPRSNWRFQKTYRQHNHKKHQ